MTVLYRTLPWGRDRIRISLSRIINYCLLACLVARFVIRNAYAAAERFCDAAGAATP